VHCCSFSTSNKITSKGCQSASKTCDFDAKNAKVFWGGGTTFNNGMSLKSGSFKLTQNGTIQ